MARSSVITLVLLVASPGCVALRPQRLAYEPAELRAEVARRSPELAADLEIPYEVDAAAIARARSIVAPHAVRGDQVRALVDGVLRPSGFGLTYAPITTTTARETLATGRGNCLALASVFVGLARALGFKAYFIDASSRVHETSASAPGLVVNAGHITAVVEIEQYKYYLDFDHTLGAIKTFRVLDDVETVAHFYNNRGFERIEDARIAGKEIDWSAAAREFTLATLVRPDFARAWNNLGIAESRMGRHEDAERHYRQAIALDPTLGGAFNNLGTLYLSLGRLPEAVDALTRAVKLAPDRAHTHLNLGRALVLSGAHERGIAELERAAELQSSDATRLLGKLARYRAQAPEPTSRDRERR